MTDSEVATEQAIVRFGPDDRVAVSGETAADIVRQMNTCATAAGWIVFDDVALARVRVWSTWLVAVGRNL